MSMYMCGDCQQFKDDDHHPMSERDICPGCEGKRQERSLEWAEEIRVQHQQWLDKQREGRV